DVAVEVGREVVAVRARVAQGEERDRIWEEQKRRNTAFAEYERKTTRRIPVVILERVSAAARVRAGGRGRLDPERRGPTQARLSFGPSGPGASQVVELPGELRIHVQEARRGVGAPALARATTDEGMGRTPEAFTPRT